MSRVFRLAACMLFVVISTSGAQESMLMTLSPPFSGSVTASGGLTLKDMEVDCFVALRAESRPVGQGIVGDRDKSGALNPDALHVARSVGIARNELNAKSAVIIRDVSDKHSIESTAAFSREFAAAGGTTLCEIRIRSGERDFTGPINQILKAKPDVIYAPIYHIECALIAREARNLGISTAIITKETLHMKEFMEFSGKASGNVIFAGASGEVSVRTGVNK